MPETRGAVRLPVRLAGAPLEQDRHVCAFFDSPEDELRLLLPFLRAGLARGQRAVYVVPRDRREQVDALIAEESDLTDAGRRGQLLLLDSEGMYLQNGRFDEDLMITIIERLLQAGPSLGFTLTRLVAHPEPALSDPEDARAFIRYESRLNAALRRFADPVICTYELSKTGTGVLLDVLRTHPIAIIGGVLHENPFYTQPAAFIAEVTARDWAMAKLDASRHQRSGRPGPQRRLDIHSPQRSRNRAGLDDATS